MNKELNKDYLDSEAAGANEAVGKSGPSRRELRKARLKAEKKAQKEAAKEAKRARKAGRRKTAEPSEVKAVQKPEAEKSSSFVKKEEPALENKVEKPVEEPKDMETPEVIEPVKEKGRKKKKKANKIVVIILVLVLLLGAAAGTMYFLDKKGMMNIEKIEVKGNTYYTDKYIVKYSKVKKGNEILSIKKDDVEENVKKLPYVKSASVSRILPHTLVISVVERAPQYAVYAGGYYIYLDKELYMLNKSNESKDLRIIEGFVPKKIEMGEKFVTEDSESFKLAIKLSNEMDKNGVKIYKISKRDTFLRIFLSQNIVCEGSYENILANVSRVDAILQSLEDQKINRATIYFGDNDYIAFSPRIE